MHSHCMIILCVAAACLPLAYVENGQADDVRATVGYTNTVTCFTGYHLDDGLMQQNVTCLNTLEYSDERNCLGT
jgi:hypothetical protein